MVEWLWLALLGLGTGILAVLVGTGGGVIMVPMLLVFFRMEPSVVAGTSLMLVAVNSLSGTAAYRRLGLVDTRSGLLFALAATPGAVSAPFVLEAVPPNTFRVLFGLMLVALAVNMVLRRPASPVTSKAPAAHGRASRRNHHVTTRSGQEFNYQYNEALAAGFNLAVGFISAFSGTGGGYLRTPVLVAFFGFPVRVAVATSIFAISVYATVGALVYFYLGHVDWYPTFVWVGAGLLVGSQIGVPLSTKIRGQWILRLLTALLFIMGTRVLVQGLTG